MGWTSSIRSALGGGQNNSPASGERDGPPLVVAPSAPIPEPKPSSAPRFEAFDPTALERGVAAIRELNTSPHASRALDLMKEQERTKQYENQVAIEQQRMQNNHFAKNAQMEMEEIRKRNEAERLNEEKQAALYKAKVQQKLEQQKLEDRRQYDEEQRQKQHELFLAQERIRRENDAVIEKQRLEAFARQAKIEQETIRVKEAAAAEGRIKQERENEDVQLRRMEKEATASLAARLESIRLHYQNINQIGASVKESLSDPRQCIQGVALVTALSLGFFGARNGTRVIGNYVQSRLGRPQLVRETSRRNWLAPSTWFSLKNLSNGSTPKAIDQVVMSPSLRSRLTWIADTAHSATKHNSPYRHLLLHGPPGTGKTLFARALAMDSHMDYAIVSGGDLSQLGNAAVTELHKLFDWAEKSPRGAVLFFDEADSFLRKGRDDSSVMSEQGRHILSAFLQRTGTESRKFMIVLASNMDLDAFDDAVKDRIDEFVEFEIPNDEQRKKMIGVFVQQYLKIEPSNPVAKWWKGESAPLHELQDSDIEVLSQKLEGYSGRQIAKFIISMRAAVFGHLAPKANLTVAEQLLSWKEWDNNSDNKSSSTATSKIIDV